MKSILILAFNDLRHDARVARQISFLSERGRLTVVCFDAPGEWKHELIRVPRIKPGFFQKVITGVLLLTRFYSSAYRMLYGQRDLVTQLDGRTFDLIVANDIECLPLAVQLRGSARILFDAHEYAPRHFEDKRTWRIFFQRFNYYLCRKYLPLADAMTTVGTGLAREYAAHFPVTPVVLTNANYYADVRPSAMIPGKIRLIHHGAANPSRQLELMIRMMDHLDDRFTLHLMLLVPAMANVKTSQYIDHLRSLIKDRPNIIMIPPVSSDQVVEVIRQYDVGVFLLPPVNFNYANTLPNKFFDYVQARLAIAIGPTPEMVQLSEQYQLGVVSKNFSPESLAEKLKALTEEDVWRFKENAGKAARLLSAEVNREILNRVVDKLFAA